MSHTCSGIQRQSKSKCQTKPWFCSHFCAPSRKWFANLPRKSARSCAESSRSKTWRNASRKRMNCTHLNSNSFASSAKHTYPRNWSNNTSSLTSLIWWTRSSPMSWNSLIWLKIVQSIRFSYSAPRISPISSMNLQRIQITGSLYIPTYSRQSKHTSLKEYFPLLKRI